MSQISQESTYEATSYWGPTFKTHISTASEFVKQVFAERGIDDPELIEAATEAAALAIKDFLITDEIQIESNGSVTFLETSHERSFRLPQKETSSEGEV